MQAARGTAIAPDDGATLRDAPVLPRARALVLVLAVLLGLLALDQATKAWAVATLQPGQPVPLVGTLLQLYLVRNSGAAFSLGAGQTWVFTLLASLALLVLLLVVAPAVRRPAWAVVTGLFGAGIAGNLVDRLVRPPGFLRGHVVDFLQLPHWPIFNVADMCICAAAALLLWLSFVGRYDHRGRPRVEPKAKAA